MQNDCRQLRLLGVNRFVSTEIISDVFKTLSYTIVGDWAQSPLKMKGGRGSFQNSVQTWMTAHKYFIAQRHCYFLK